MSKPADERIKRALDLIIASALALPAALVVLASMAAIRMSSPGPAMFRQVRVGRYERPFTLYKLRTMRVGTGDKPSHHSASSEITSIGKWLRRTKLDELPQLLNVIRGDMSFVGPRPCLPMQTSLVEERRNRGLYDIRPGITGLAQLQGIDMSEPARLAAADAAYLSQQGIVPDLKILWRTFSGAGGGDAIRA